MSNDGKNNLIHYYAWCLTSSFSYSAISSWIGGPQGKADQVQTEKDMLNHLYTT